MTRTTVYWVGTDGALHSRYGDSIVITPNPADKPTAVLRVTSQNNLSVTVSVSQSTAVSPSTISQYAVTWEPGATDVEATALPLTHTYATAGTKTITLVVTDSDGRTGSTQITVTLASPNRAPVASIQSLTTSGMTATAVSNSTDPDGDAITSTVWQWGDGGSSSGTPATHTYSAGGTYTVSLTVTDARGLASTPVTRSVTIVASVAGPTAKIQTTSTGMTVSYTTTGSQSSDGTAITYDVNWGDGSTHSTSAANSHTYSASGPWTITLTVKDIRGQTATATAPGLGRDARYRPFTSDAPWNTAIGSGAVFGDNQSASYASFIAPNPAVNFQNYTVSIVMAKDTDPVVSLTDSGSDGTHASQTAATAVSFVRVTGLQIPDNPSIEATSTSTTNPKGTDTWTPVIQPNGHTTQEISGKVGYDSPGTWHAGHASISDLWTDGLNQGRRASNTSEMAGLIRLDDLNRGVIQHILGCSLPGSSLGNQADRTKPAQYQWPASQVDGDWTTSYTGNVRMGTLWAIPGSVDVTQITDSTGAKLTGTGLMLARALQDYGAYIIARAGTNALMLEYGSTNTQRRPLLSAWTACYKQMREVLNSDATHVGGGGTPRQPTQPPVYDPNG